MNGSITTEAATNAEVTIASGSGTITLGTDITIDTNVTNNDGDITLGSIDATTDHGQALTIDSGTGAVSIGVIGGTEQLDGLTVNTADGASDSGNITITGIGGGVDEI